jgi:hypothetical protein
MRAATVPAGTRTVSLKAADAVIKVARQWRTRFKESKEGALISSELEYCMMRAREEARRALRSNLPEAAAVHQRLSVRYSARALLLRAAENDVDTSPRMELTAVSA